MGVKLPYLAQSSQLVLFFTDSAQSQSATLGMGAMNVAMTFVSLALIGEITMMNHRLGHKNHSNHHS